MQVIFVLFLHNMSFFCIDYCMRENKMINSLRKINCIMINEKIAELIDNIVIMHIKDSIKGGYQQLNINNKTKEHLNF